MPDAYPYDAFRSEVLPEWSDANQHFNSVRYLDVFRSAFIEFLGVLGVARAREPGAGTLFQAESHIRYERELLVGAPIRVRSWLVAVDGKRIHHFHEMFHAGDGFRAATAEYLHLHIARETRRVGAMPEPVLERLRAYIASAPAHPQSDDVGRRIGLPGVAAPH